MFRKMPNTYVFDYGWIVEMMIEDPALGIRLGEKIVAYLETEELADQLLTTLVEAGGPYDLFKWYE